MTNKNPFLIPARIKATQDLIAWIKSNKEFSSNDKARFLAEKTKELEALQKIK